MSEAQKAFEKWYLGNNHKGDDMLLPSHDLSGLHTYYYLPIEDMYNSFEAGFIFRNSLIEIT